MRILLLWFSAEIECPDPGRVKHGHRRGNVFTYMSYIQFICHHGYHAAGHHGAMLCGVDGNWTASPPHCTREWVSDMLKYTACMYIYVSYFLVFTIICFKCMHPVEHTLTGTHKHASNPHTPTHPPTPPHPPHTHTRTHAHTRARTHARAHTHTHTHARTHAHTHAGTHAHMHACTYVEVQTHVWAISGLSIWQIASSWLPKYFLSQLQDVSATWTTPQKRCAIVETEGAFASGTPTLQCLSSVTRVK